MSLLSVLKTIGKDASDLGKWIGDGLKAVGPIIDTLDPALAPIITEIENVIAGLPGAPSEQQVQAIATSIATLKPLKAAAVSPSPTIFQIDPSSPYAAQVNPLIYNEQREEQVIGVTNAAAQMVTNAQSEYPGDLNANTVNAGSGLAWNKMTEVQKEIVLAAKIVDPWASASLPADLVAFIKVNAGPVDYWNASYEQAGVVPNVWGFLSTRTVVVVANGTAQEVTGLLLPV